MAQQGPPPVRVGVGVLVFRDRKDPHFVLGKRIGSLGAGSWSLPGGHLENGETFAECAARETKEETGLEIEDVRYLTAVETSWPSGQHYVTIFMAGVLGNVGAEPKVMEPEKCEDWLWRSMHDIRTMGRGRPEHLFEPIYSLMEQRPSLVDLLDDGFEAVVGEA